MAEKKKSDHPDHPALPRPGRSVLNRLFPEERDPKTTLYLSLILIAYSLVAFIGISRHEMWRDELEPWLVGSCSDSLSDFFHNMKLGSNPYVWYLMLHFISKITLNPVIVQVVHLLFAIGAVYVFLRYAPFTLLQKILFCCGYYILYEYGIISRGYALTIFFLFLFCALFKKYWSANIPLALVIFFLANATGGFGAILSISLLIFVLANYYFNEMSEGKKKQKVRFAGWAAAIILFSVWVAFKSISPPPDSVYATKWFTEYDPDRLLKILWRVWSGFVPVPDVSEMRFWNTNILNRDEAGPVVSAILTVFSCFFILYSILLFSRKRTVLLFYLAGTFGILLFSYLNSSIFVINGARYHGFLYIVFIVSLWLFRYFPEGKRTPIFLLTALSEKVKAYKWQNHVLVALLAVNAVAGGIAYGKDMMYQFSAVESTGKYIVENNLQRYPATGFIYYAVSPVTAYTRKPFYYPENDSSSTFPLWTMKNYTADMNEVAARMLTRISKSNDTFLVVFNFILDTFMLGDVQFLHLADFNESVVKDEVFSVSLAHKYDLQKNLDDKTPLTERRVGQYIGLVTSLLQQNRLDDCDKLMEKIKAKALENRNPRFHYVMGMLDTKRNRVNEAKAQFAKAIELNYKPGDVYFQLGMLYYQEQKGDSAIYAWEKTIALDSSNLDAYSNIGVCYLNFKKDLDKAGMYWNKTVKINPEYIQGYINLMILCQQKKDDNCLLDNLRIVLKKGVRPEDIKSRGVNLTDEMLRKASS